ncbi:hypothetical protein LTR37_015537 [Vermiconidia calcicola]|uniref:Uncharacterized protein n=1 Tax=Vermiconidia calcicola TaxID=1690605 RepID=A0ACC3MRY4_9PEZI|nr:hypothetical protein LTR37_015537 [Vermiconidia calcicola]
MQLRLALRSALFMVPWLTHLLLANVILSTLLPLSALFPDFCYTASSYIAESVWYGIQRVFTRVNRADIIVSGDENLNENESAIVISNHVEWTDFYLIQELALRAGMLGKCRWFAKQQLKRVPFLGWGLWAMGMPLVSRNWSADQKEMDRVFQGVVKRQWPMWLISFTEATRYTHAKHLEAEAWCKAHGKRVPQHTLFPRAKGFIACCQNLAKAPQMKAVYDVTIAYARKGINGWQFQQPPSFAESLLVPRLDEEWRFFVHVDRHPLEELPRSSEELAQWLEDRWVEKGERLEVLRQKLVKGMPWEAA